MASECFHHENGPQKQALLIAPSYDLLPDLKLEGTGNDLKIMKTILEGKSFQFHSIKEVTGQSATRENILRSMAEVTRLAVEGSVLVVYYSGHGYSWKGGPDSADQDEGLFPALTPQDMKSGDIDKQCVSGYDLKDYLLELSKKKVSVTFIFDCCFSGHMYRGPELDDSDFKCTKARQVTRESLLKLDGEITASQDQGNLIPRGETNETPPKRQWKRINEGWLPQEKDKFFHLAACSSIEHAWEGVYRRNIKCGLFTKILSDILERCSDTSTRAQLTYKGLFSLIQRGFMMGNYSYQTPQIEGGNLDTVLFGHSVVPQSSKLVDIGDVTTEDNTTTVQLQAGYLQLLQAGEYDVFKPTVNDSHIFHDNNSDNEFWLGAIEVDEKDIEMVTATARVIEQRKGSEIQPGCKASLRRATQNARTSVLIISSIDEDRMKEKLLETQEFRMCCMEPQSIIWEQELWPGDKFHIFGPRDGDWCPEIYFDTPELRHTVLKMSLTVTWRDQGWGNRKGELFLKLMRPNPIGEPLEVAEFRRLFWIAEHHQTTQTVVIDNHPVVIKAREGDFYRFMRNAGGGGGHELTVSYFQAKVQYRALEPQKSAEFTQSDGVVLQKEPIESDERWCARVKGNMIVPPVYTHQEDVMATNLQKYSRYRFVLKQPPSNENLLLNVKLKISKLENVKPFGANPTLRNERLEEARSKPDLYAAYQDNPNSPMPRFQAHKMKRQFGKATLIDQSGDAIVVQVTNNEEIPIHVLLLIFQLDGEISVMHPPGKGASTELPKGASIEKIFRLTIPEHALQKFTQPDPTKDEATEGIETIMLYAMSDKFDMGPLVQPALELGSQLKGKGNSEDINPLKSYLKALKSRNLEDDDQSGKWLIEKRMYVLVKHS